MSTKEEKTIEKDYNISDEEDYVIIVRKDGTSNGFYPNAVIRAEGQIDARFIAATYVLQSQECFDYVLEKFRQERLPGLQEGQEVAQPQTEPTSVAESEAKEG